jgi:hypothetical protein
MITGSEACRTLATAFRLSALPRASLELRRLQGLGGLLLQLILKSTSRKNRGLSHLRQRRFARSPPARLHVLFPVFPLRECISSTIGASAAFHRQLVRMRFEPNDIVPARVRARFESHSFDSLRRNLDLWFPISVPPTIGENEGPAR